ncbi:YadA C-terminal domain-containing protein [Vibrio breoganii]|uniref:YadA C-terminal domain-containing protein n=1 Tax=Vibrio breoganii TaxID=553239 RepID=UPI000C859AB5|nr:YadA C-terminal domain-containing protein [Vibrio breoganii]PMG02906.1 hypothetical protein BCV08_07235 [Vibrio breoganii]PMH17889.1 hypothetical protein BCU74_10300 [Vibrio breoganii]PMM18441.1 hypothetical protein BCT60_17705 [Vibrio breoganii]TKG22729.1 hypothetical protein FCV81_07830 [Vibrio breoganii]
MKNLSKTLITFAILSVAGQAFAAPATTLEQRLQNLESQSRDQYSYNGDTSRKTRELERRINEHGQQEHAMWNEVSIDHHTNDRQQVEINKNSQRLDGYSHLIVHNTQQVSANKQQVASNTAALHNVQSEASANTRANNAQASMLMKHATELDQQRTNIAQNHNDIEQTRAHVAQDHAQVQANSHGVTEVGNKALENRAGIEQNKAQITAHDKQITDANTHARNAENDATYARKMSTQNADAISQNQDAIKGLREDMEQMAKNVDGAYAESAAFAGLVDPYGVGKFAVTAAVGYHGDAQAVAVGVGERFTENFTAKLGGAYDTATESMSAYAGVGYEF